MASGGGPRARARHRRDGPGEGLRGSGARRSSRRDARRAQSEGRAGHRRARGGGAGRSGAHRAYRRRPRAGRDRRAGRRGEAARPGGASADEPLREDIASAWASPALWSVGGRDELRILVSQAGGPAAIEAAGAALRGSNRDAEVDLAATALLARTIAAAGKRSHRERVHAIAVAPRPAGPVLDALHDAAKDADVTIQVAALARLVEVAAEREASIKALEAIAGDKARAAAASRAALALSIAGDARIQAWIEADLASPDATTRFGAVTALAALGRAGRAAPVLADADPSLRTRAACTLLAAPSR